MYEQELDEALADGKIDMKEWCFVVLRHDMKEFFETEVGERPPGACVRVTIIHAQHEATLCAPQVFS